MLHTLKPLKRLAKEVKKEFNIPHTVALERVAQLHGFSNWNKATHCFKNKLGLFKETDTAIADSDYPNYKAQFFKVYRGRFDIEQ